MSWKSGQANLGRRRETFGGQHGTGGVFAIGQGGGNRGACKGNRGETEREATLQSLKVAQRSLVIREDSGRNSDKYYRHSMSASAGKTGAALSKRSGCERGRRRLETIMGMVEGWLR